MCYIGLILGVILGVIYRVYRRVIYVLYRAYIGSNIGSFPILGVPF